MSVEDFVIIVEEELCYDVLGVQECFVVFMFRLYLNKRYFVIGVGIPGDDKGNCINMHGPIYKVYMEYGSMYGVTAFVGVWSFKRHCYVPPINLIILCSTCIE
jgi:hypothetical protein